MVTLGNPIKRLRGLLAGSGGTTLMEVLVAVGLISAATGIVGSGLFRVTSIQRFWRDDVIATKDLRHAGSWFAGDAINAEDALDSGGLDRDSVARQSRLRLCRAVGNTLRSVAP